MIRLKKVRIYADLNQKDVAQKLGVVIILGKEKTI